ncbi:hypothetical protein RAS1_34250 [Phycisphaerae bacterium RAS1]|nr:hypothetical protein RAS1_34250 [Phycisphaerae bacterium RAS1]
MRRRYGDPCGAACSAASAWQKAVVAVLLAAAMAAGGCESGTTGEGPSASPVQDPMLEGIPLPHGFTKVLEKSDGTVSGQFRLVRFYYTGSTDPAAVHRFYEEYMPSAGFTQVERSLEQGAYMSRFQSSSEECSIRVKREKSKTSLVVNVRPLPAATADRSGSPPVRQPR